MKIIVLDGFTLNPGDLSWEGLAQYGDVTNYDRTPPALIVERSKDAEILLTNKTPLDENTFSELPKLRYVGVLATGYDKVDVQAAARHNITVTNVPAYATCAVGQMTFALLLELCNRVYSHSTGVKDGRWSNNPDFCYWDYPGIELNGKTIGIIGYGSIGQQVARIAAAFDMNIIAYDISPTEQSYIKPKFVTLEELLEWSDVVSLHCPLTVETKEIICKETLNRMKRSAFLINTSRGALINEHDLADALNSDIIAGAGLDVLTNEPPEEDNPLFGAKNCFITPHIAWAAKEARQRLLNIAINNLKQFLEGRPINVVCQG